jgi:acetylglutamate kinase
MDVHVARARTLVEALPYIQRFAGKTVVVKYGGSAMSDAERRAEVMRDVVLMQTVGIRPVLVHGGGPEIDRLMERLGLEPRKVDGLRVTDEATMEVVEMALAGSLNKALVSSMQRAGGRAVGLSGKDGGLIQARRTGSAELGLVGEVERIDPSVLHALGDAGFVPIVCSVAADANGGALNVNADLAAGAIAAALRAEKIVLMTDVEGIYRDYPDPASLVSEMTTKETIALMSSGKVETGMIPKVQSCLTALNGGVASAHVIDGRLAHSLLIELFTDAGIGTMIRP